MNLKETKEWFSKCEPTEHSDMTKEVIQWLITEVEILQDEINEIYLGHRDLVREAVFAVLK